VVTEEQVREILRDVMDPELGVSILDLGLVYDVSIGVDRIMIVMTTTTPACPMSAYLVHEVEATLRARRMCGPSRSIWSGSRRGARR